MVNVFEGERDLFQFQYGAIESVLLISGVESGLLFQFQYGAIERIVIIMSPNNKMGFQFQYGAIESIHLA